MQPKLLKYILDIESVIEEIEFIKQKTKNDFQNFLTISFCIPELMKEMEDRMRKDEERNRESLMTKAAIQKGFDSGIRAKNRTADEIIESAKKRSLAKIRDKRNLLPFIR